ncbi:MAG: ketopantoate reductase family protein [Candidatus Omnitrophota bacterium]
MEKKKILVIGLGPAGGILSAHLASCGHSLYGIDIWKEHVEAIRMNGLRIEHLVSLHMHFEEVVESLEDLHETAFDYVVLAVKAPFLPEVVAEMRKLPGSFTIVIAQNGIDNENYVANFFEVERILRMAVHFAGNIVSPGVIKMNFFQRPNYVGCICDDEDDLAARFSQILTRAELITEATPNIRKFTWKKGILNAILAPVSAVLGVTMAEIMHFTETRQIVEALITESIDVARAAGYDYGPQFFDECVEFLLKAGHHKPSMLIDLENGNPTEIDYINGKIVEFARLHQIPVPYNAAITGMVKAKEYYCCNNKRRGK